VAGSRPVAGRAATKNSETNGIKGYARKPT
jgi:hypothetical protein